MPRIQIEVVFHAHFPEWKRKTLHMMGFSNSNDNFHFVFSIASPFRQIVRDSLPGKFSKSEYLRLYIDFKLFNFCSEVTLQVVDFL